MATSETVTVNLLSSIKNEMINICGDDLESPIYLQDVSFLEKKRSRGRGTIIVNCVFINSEYGLCADLYRKSAGGCVDFFCGKMIDDMDELGLNEIFHALENGSYSVPDTIKKERSRISRRSRASIFKLPLLTRGA